MKTYLFDVTIKGIVEADSYDRAIKTIKALSDEDGYIYIDEFTDLKIIFIPNRKPQEKPQCPNPTA